MSDPTETEMLLRAKLQTANEKNTSNAAIVDIAHDPILRFLQERGRRQTEFLETAAKTMRDVNAILWLLCLMLAGSLGLLFYICYTVMNM